MKTLKTLLVENDPLVHEPPVSTFVRSRSRAEVVAAAAAHATETPVRRSYALRTVVFAVMVLSMAFMASRLTPRLGFSSYAAVRFEVRLAEASPGAGYRTVPIPGAAGGVMYLSPSPLVDNSGILSARLVPEPDGVRYSIDVTFTPEAAQRVRAATLNHIGKRIAILIDDTVVMAPVVRAAIGASARITGDFSKTEAERIVNGIAAP